MKTLILVATLASAALVAPLNAATTAPVLSLEQLMTVSADRRGRGCDTAHDIAEHPRCTR